MLLECIARFSLCSIDYILKTWIILYLSSAKSDVTHDWVLLD
jgi:hypothetical protein